MSSPRPPSGPLPGPSEPTEPTETESEGSPHRWPEPTELSFAALGRELRSWIDQEQTTYAGDIPASTLRSYLQDRTNPDSKLLPALLHTVEQPLFRSLLRAHDPRGKRQIIKELIDQQRDLYNQASIEGLSEFLSGFVDVAIIEPAPPQPPPPQPPPPQPPPPQPPGLLDWLRSRGQGKRADGRGDPAQQGHKALPEGGTTGGTATPPPRREARAALLLGGGFFALTTLVLAVVALGLNEQKRDLSTQTLLLRQNLDEACDSFSLYLIKNSLNSDATEDIAKQALETLDKQSASCSKSANYYGALGSAYSILSQWQQAASAFSRATKLSPTDGWNYNQLGRAKYSQSLYSEALDAFDSAISLGFNKSTVYYNRGLTNKHLGNTQAACDDFRQAIEKGFDSQTAQVQMLDLPGCLVIPYRPAVQFPLGNAPSR